MNQPGAFSNPNNFNLDCPCCYRPGEPLFSSSDQQTKQLSAAHKLFALRVAMAEHDIDAYLVFTEDAHNSEYVSKCDERRSFLTGFTGSAGVALVTRHDALLWTDARYFLQAAEQLPQPEWTLMKQYEPNVPTLEDYLYDNCRESKIGVDPSTVAQSRVVHWRDGWRRKASSAGEDESKIPIVRPVRENLVDGMWPEGLRPPLPQNPMSVHEAGESTSSKLSRVRDAFRKEANAVGLIVTALDQTAWLFNLRGSDIDCNPVFFSYGIVSLDKAHLFVGRRDGLSTDWVDDEVKEHLEKGGVELCGYEEFGSGALERIFDKGGRILVEKGSCSMAVAEAITSAATGCVMVETESVSPVEMFKAIKNEVEIQGLRECSLRDSAAIVEFAAWLTEQMGLEEGERDDMHEAALSDTLLTHRQKQPHFIQPSFDTISSVGPNSAVIHYKPESNSPNERILTPTDIYLLDSGGQYEDGTTDITRTFHFGTPTPEQRRYYTRVLQGHIQLAMVIFPSKTPGLVLDTLARASLWKDGLTYGHGTGHGIGAYLNVHEGPMGIGGGNQPGDVIRNNPRMQAYYLEPVVKGMYLSNEPGYYLDGSFGFRIESDMVAVEHATNTKGEFLTFETVTKVPMCRALVDVELMTREEVEWLNRYHEDCYESLKGFFSIEGDGGGNERVLAWLRAETLPL